MNKELSNIPQLKEVGNSFTGGFAVLTFDEMSNAKGGDDTLANETCENNETCKGNTTCKNNDKCIGNTTCLNPIKKAEE